MRFVHLVEQFHGGAAIDALLLRRDFQRLLGHHRFVEFHRVFFAAAKEQELTVERGVEPGLDRCVFPDFLPFHCELDRCLLREISGVGLVACKAQRVVIKRTIKLKEHRIQPRLHGGIIAGERTRRQDWMWMFGLQEAERR